MNNHSIQIERAFNFMRVNPVFFLWLIWFIFLALDISLRYLGALKIAPHEIILLNFVGGGVVNHFWFFFFLPQVVFLKKWKLVLIQLAIIISIYFIIKLYLLGYWSTNDIQLTPFFVNEAIRLLQFILYTSAIWGFYIMGIRQELLKKLEIDLIKLQIEHKSLQLNPHFVLNMITQFSASIMKVSKSLFKEFSLFTEILSYSYKNHQKQNYLDQELRILENYIACQKYRFGKKLQFIISKNFSIIEPNKFPLPKWTLMTFLENVFKHGNCYDSKCPCALTLNIFPWQDKMLFTFSLTNALEDSPPEFSSEFGIEAVSRILNYYFPGNVQLFHGKSSTEFNLLLYICYGGCIKDRTPR